MSPKNSDRAPREKQRYRKVAPRIWNDARFRALSDDGKLVFLFLLTHPNLTSLGAMKATVSGLAEELGWELGRFRKAFAEGLREGFGEGFREALPEGLREGRAQDDPGYEKPLFEYDPEALFLSLPNFLKYNPPESPNVVKSWENSWDLLPECDAKVRLGEHIKAFLEGFGEGFREGSARWLPLDSADPSRNQKQKQKQKQKQNIEEPPTPFSAKPDVPAGPSRTLEQSPEMIPIPEPLDTAAFRGAWADWLVYLRQRNAGRLPPQLMLTEQIVHLAGLGPAEAIKAIKNSIRNGWGGPWPEKAERGGVRRRSQNGAAYDPNIQGEKL